MANIVYDYYVTSILAGNAAWTTSDIKCACVSSAYTPDAASDRYLSNINAAAIIRTSGNLTGKSVTSRICDAGDLVIYSIVGAVDVAKLVLYYDTGVDTSSVLVCCIDSGTGLPLTPDGRPVRIVWSNSGNKIFRL